MLYSAPAGFTAITLSTGEYIVDKSGNVDLPDDLPIGDQNALDCFGFTPAPAKPAKAKAATDATDA